MSLPISINGTDYSGLLEYTTQGESFRRVEGINKGVNKAGNEIYDDLATKYDLVTSIRPCRPAELANLMNDLSGSTCSVTFFSFMRGHTVTQTMRCTNIEAMLGFLKLQGSDIILKNIPLNFRQK